MTDTLREEDLRVLKQDTVIELVKMIHADADTLTFEDTQ